MSFTDLRNRLNANFASAMQEKVLFETDINKDELWALYLDSFPGNTNPIYRVRREFDCSCCRHFLKNIGGTVYIDTDLNIRSIFEFDAGSDTFQPVMDALAKYVKDRGTIIGRYWSDHSSVGTEHSCELDGTTVKTWSHFYLDLPRQLVFHGQRGTLGSAKSQFNATHDVFKRSLDEISLEAIDTVLELIKSNTLYKGTEWLEPLKMLRGHKIAYDELPEAKKDNYCWAMTETVGPVLGRIRNHSIGVLLTDISEDMELDEAVRRYEKIVAPANYKRPKAIFTKKMLEDAQQTITELGYLDALPRRFATLDDIRVNNILFSNRDAGKRIQGGNVFDEMLADAKMNPKQFSRVEEIGVEKFIADVLPGAHEVEAFVENRHAANMVSLIAPVNQDAKSMFKWGNNFSWAYAGNMTDSDIRENVKSAGGKVDGVLRFSLQWNDAEPDDNDLDAHCKEPNGGEHIFFSHRVSMRTRGNLDIDIIDPSSQCPGKPAVENITWPNKAKMIPGDYLFWVHCYTSRGGKGGFRAEIEFDGQVYRFDYTKAMRQGEEVKVATVTLHEDGTFTIKEHLDSQMSNREIWGVKSNRFVPVSVVMYSPNYWDEQTGIGHKHYMFMLKGCVNPENPNGFYNEFLKNKLLEHKRVFEALGGRMAVQDTEDQLSGLGFSSTKRNDLVVKVKGATERTLKIKF